MADTAAHLVDRVLPEVPIRQWVLTLPYPLRYRCAYDATFLSEVLRAFLRALFSELRRRAKSQWGTSRGQCGAVTFIHRFGSALNLNVHFHSLVLDGEGRLRPIHFFAYGGSAMQHQGDGWRVRVAHHDRLASEAQDALLAAVGVRQFSSARDAAPGSRSGGLA
jgi:hypothetical protein